MAMKKLLLVFTLFISMLFLTWCSIDRNDEKTKEINLLNSEVARLKLKIEDQNFEKNLKCQWLLDWLKRRYNNVFSIYYSEYWNTCYIKYHDSKTKELVESAIDDFGPN